MSINTVEKIGGTSMSRFPQLADSLFMRDGVPEYNRIFVVSAYGGITDMLLEHKHSGSPGVFTLFSDGDDAEAWQDRLSDVCRRMREINAEFYTDRAGRQSADHFINERIEEARSCLGDVQRVCRFGSFELDAYLDRVRELLTSMGEAHSAYNATMLLRERGLNARFVDLTGWHDSRSMTLDERLRDGLSDVDFATELPIATGYAQCAEGIVKKYSRGYTEITMSRLALLTRPTEAVIHKEYHLSSADPKVVGVNRSVPIGRTNYDVADQLANLGMEAIHPSAASMLRREHIPLRVKHAFEPEHDGTLIDCDYRSDEPKVEIIAGRRGLLAIEVFDQDMMGVQMEFEKVIIDTFKRFTLRPVGIDVNANSMTHYVVCPLRTAKRVTERLSQHFPEAIIDTRKVAFVCAVGSDLDIPGILAKCAIALGAANVPIHSASQPLRGVDVRFVVDEADYETAIRALHGSVIDQRKVANIAA